MLYLFETITITLILINSILIWLPNKRDHYVNLLTSLFLLIVFVTLVSLLLPATSKISTYAVMITMFVLACTSYVAKLLQSNLEKILENYKNNVWIYLVILSLFTIYFFTFGIEIKFFQSPDTHGFATAVGYFSKNFSYEALVNDYLKATGLSVPIFIGQQTPILPSTWSIPDIQLRYASDMIFCVGRVGFPIYVALLSSVVKIQYLFPIFMLAFGILGCFSSAYLSLKIFTEAYELATSQQACINKINFSKLILILGFSFWLTIFVLEGTLNQLWLLVACQFHILQLTNCILEKNESEHLKFVYLSTAPLFISVIYPHGLLILLVISTPFLVYILSNQERTFIKNLKNLTIATIATSLVIPLSLYLLHGSFDVIIKNVLSGVSGAPYDLSHSNLFEYLPGIPYMFSPRGDKTYHHFLDSKTLMYLSWLILFGFSLIGAFTLLINKRASWKKILLISSLPILLLTAVLSGMLKHPFHPYIYSRYCTQFITLGLPFLAAIVLSNIKSEININLSNKVSSFLSILLIFSVINFLLFTHKFYKHSDNFNIIQNSEVAKKLELNNSILVLDKPEHKILSLALYGPVYNLTSDWAIPYFRTNTFINNKVKIYKVEIKNNRASFKLIGYLTINKDFSGPINATEILNNPNFIGLN